MLRSISCAVFAVAVALAACGGGGGSFEEDLEPEVVTNLPPGDATGTDSAMYDLTTVTTSCSGDCTIDGGGDDESSGDFPVCDVGTELTATAEMTQNGGVLEIDVDNSEYVSQLAGGINADGSFEVGGYVTQNGGEVEITSRESGTFTSGTGVMTATGRLQIRGDGLDCLIEVDIDGEPSVAFPP